MKIKKQGGPFSLWYLPDWYLPDLQKKQTERPTQPYSGQERAPA